MTDWLPILAGPVLAAAFAEWRSRQRTTTAVREGFTVLATEARVNRERQDERHEANQEIMHEIRSDVKRINGTVAAHAVEIANLKERNR